MRTIVGHLLVIAVTVRPVVEEGAETVSPGTAGPECPDGTGPECLGVNNTSVWDALFNL
jgi:hypothetical protein